MSRSGVVALVRLVHALFFVAVAAYGFLSYSPFAYAQFIKPNVVPALTEFVMLSQWYFWIVLLTTVLTLMPHLRRGRGRTLSIAYVVVWSAVGVAALYEPPLRTIGNSRYGFVMGLLALAAPVWVAAIDHVVRPAAELRPARVSRVLAACMCAACVAWASYSLAVPFRLTQTPGIDLTKAGLAVALGSSLVADLYCFTALFLALATLMALAGFSRAPARVEYWLFVVVLGACAALVLYLLVCASIAFSGRDAVVASAALGLALAAVWADLARLRGHQSPGISHGSPATSHESALQTGDRRLVTGDWCDSLALFSAPIAGVGSRRVAFGAAIVMPMVAYGLVEAVSHLDWNFLLQKLTVLLVWLATFAIVSKFWEPGPADRLRQGYGESRLRSRLHSARAKAEAGHYLQDMRPAAVPLLILGLYHGVVSLEARDSGSAGASVSISRDAGLTPRIALERYAALDPSYRLIRDARTARSVETAEYYAFLRSHTLIPASDVPALDIDFVKPMAPAAGTPSGRPPDIYLFIVDSLRRDYLSPYNPRVTFTPEIGGFARDSFVFDRAFTRYAGTALAMASIWAGGMVPHALEQPAFARRNTLLKLLDANRYVRMMNVDHIIYDLVAPDANLVQLDRGRGTMQFDVCATMNELEGRLETADASRPVFFYSLPQNVHIAVASRRKVPEGESYPGFFAPVASSVRRIDGCLGGFIDFLKRANRYDNSIVILTSDHGDSLGEEGRWGHAFYIVPEVMRIPLIVHVPSSFRAGMSVDLSALTFSSDLVPSLYALLGYEPEAPGPLSGHSTFEASNADSGWRRRDAFLLASSYGAVYGMLRRNGTRLYVVDAVDGRDSAFDLVDDAVGRRLEITETMTAENRALIREHLAALARQHRYRPRS